MTKPKIFVTRQLFDETIDFLKRNSDVEVFEGSDDPAPKGLILSKIRDIDGLLTLLTDSIDTEMIEAGRNLKVISNCAVGYNNIDVEAATEHGIYVTNTPGILTETTADCTFALMLAAARRIAEADRYVRSGKWIHAWGLKMFLGSDVHGKTLGIIGLGRIGRAMAKRAKGFGMSVIYYDVNRSIDSERDLGITYAEMEHLLKEADFVTIHVPLEKETHHLIGARELSIMKRDAYLINTSRGPVVDEGALYDALSRHVIKGAALDVFELEPIDSKNKLLELDNVVLTPHIASASVETRKKMAMMAATNLVSVLSGEESPNLVNLDVKRIRPLSRV